ncbi:MAG TPA: phosphoglycerate mutase family protein [Thermoanaerobaculia bacterium]|jgi:broad specificity phosphatase PhoE
MKKLLVVFLLLFAVAAQAGTVIVVRHAEADASDPKERNPALSEAGIARAKALLSVAEKAGVKAVYVTQFRRTRETAEPLALALKVPVVTIEVDPQNVAAYAPALAKRIAAEHPNETVLVVGHSNTVPLIVKELGGSEVPAIEHSQYGKVYVVTNGGVVAAQYGAN